MHAHMTDFSAPHLVKEDQSRSVVRTVEKPVLFLQTRFFHGYCNREKEIPVENWLIST